MRKIVKFSNAEVCAAIAEWAQKRGLLEGTDRAEVYLTVRSPLAAMPDFGAELVLDFTPTSKEVA